MTRIGRQLSIGKTDNTSDQRTPRKRLRLIPTDVRESFVPVIPARAVQRQNEWDLTRIAPNRPRAEGSPIEVKGTVRNESGSLLRGALIEIWNANHYGRYRHVEDHSGLKLDENFFGIGRLITDEYGNYGKWENVEEMRQEKNKKKVNLELSLRELKRLLSFHNILKN